MSINSLDSVIDKDNSECEESDSSTSTYSDNYINSQFQKKYKKPSTVGNILKKLKSLKNGNVKYTYQNTERTPDIIKKFDPCYQFHNCYTEKNHVITLFENKREKIKLVLLQILGKVLFTSNMWIALNSAAFLSLTIHFVDSSWKLNSFLLDIISIEKLEKEFNNFEFLHYRYVAYILNLVISWRFKHMDKSISKLRTLMSYIRSSKPANNALKHFCNIKGIPYLSVLNLPVADDHVVKEKYLNAEDLNNINSILGDSSQISAFLDPCIKISVFKTENEKNKIVDLISGLNEYISETTQQIAFANNSNNDKNYF
ncbi:24909_t:CDS:2, partial [Cetraspora pellucida]